MAEKASSTGKGGIHSSASASVRPDSSVAADLVSLDRVVINAHQPQSGHSDSSNHHLARSSSIRTRSQTQALKRQADVDTPSPSQKEEDLSPNKKSRKASNAATAGQSNRVASSLESATASNNTSLSRTRRHKRNNRRKNRASAAFTNETAQNQQPSVSNSSSGTGPVVEPFVKRSHKRARLSSRPVTSGITQPLTLDQPSPSSTPADCANVAAAKQPALAAAHVSAEANTCKGNRRTASSHDAPNNGASNNKESSSRRRSSRLTSRPSTNTPASAFVASVIASNSNANQSNDLLHPPVQQSKQHSFFRKYRRSHAQQLEEHAYPKQGKSTSSAGTGTSATNHHHHIHHLSSSAGLTSLIASTGNPMNASSLEQIATGPSGSSSSGSTPASLLATHYSLPSGSSTSAYASGSSTNNGIVVGQSESADQDEMGRLQALLEAKGLPPHFFGALGPRVQHLLHRSMGTGNCAKAAALLPALQFVGDEGQQLQAVMEMCQLLVMGNEDTLVGFPIKQTVPALIQLMGMEHNFDIMNHACRALTYMMESLPRSCSVVVDAVPAFLEKLQAIQCMDVAEQALTALEMLSRRHAKAILHHKGVHACLMYLDFFSTNAQRAALQITANCCHNLTAEEFVYIRESLPTLATHLNNQDKKCVESVCLAFARLVEAYHSDADILTQISANNLFANIQQLLLLTPPLISSSTFVMILRMLAAMCACSGLLAVELLKLNIHQTLRFLLVGSKAPANESSEEPELATRSAQELYEITSLIAELMPQLPNTGLFEVEQMLYRVSPELVQWQWRDDRGAWHNYSTTDCRLLETAHASGEEDLTLHTAGRTYMMDLHGMQQINEETGSVRQIQRRVAPAATVSAPPLKAECSSNQPDARVNLLKEKPEILQDFMRSLFGLIYEIYNSSAAPSVRNKCLRALLRITYHADASLLRTELRYAAVSSQLAAMLPASDLRIVVGAVQMSHVLMEKLADVFSVHFVREGVLHQFHRLLENTVYEPEPNKQELGVGCIDQPSATSAPIEETAQTSSLPNSSATGYWSQSLSSTSASTSSGGSQSSVISFRSEDYQLQSSAASSSSSPTANAQRFADVLKRKRSSKKSSNKLVGLSSSTSVSSRKAKVDSAESNCSTTPTAPANASCDSSPSTSGNCSVNNKSYGSAYVSMPFLSSVSFSQSQSNTYTSNDGTSAHIIQSQQRHVEAHSQGVANTDSTNVSTQSQLSANSLAAAVAAIEQNSMRHQGGAGRGRPSFKLSSAASKTSSFFASLHPSRWARWNSGQPGATLLDNQLSPSSSRGGVVNRNSNSSGLILPDRVSASLGSSQYPALASPRVNSCNRDKIRRWIQAQAKKFLDKHFGGLIGSRPTEGHPALETLNKLTASIQTLEHGDAETALRALRDILLHGDISPFELIHSGLIQKLTNFLVLDEPNNLNGSRERRICTFLHVFLSTPAEPLGWLENLELMTPQLRFESFSALVAKLNACISQLEQFPVRIHDVLSGTSQSLRGATGTSNSLIGGTSSMSSTFANAFKLNETQQLKCQLQRHRDCRTLRQWRSGPVKVDPLAPVQMIERYLLLRGYGRPQPATSSETGGSSELDEDDDSAEEEDEDEDESNALSHTIFGQAAGKHSLQLLYGDHVLPYNSSIYQAIRTYAYPDAEPTDEPELMSNMWSQTHTIYYRLAPPEGQDDESEGQSNAHGKRSWRQSSSRSQASKRKDELWIEGKLPKNHSLLDQFTVRLPGSLAAQLAGIDASLDAINLLRILYLLNQHWGYFFQLPCSYNPALSTGEFINSKLAAKANRQLQDPLVIATGNLPTWLPQLAYCCPFLFPFECRHLLFYVACFDRDRALQRLLDARPGGLGAQSNSNNSTTAVAGSEHTERLTPRLDRRKRTITRDDVLKQAETVLNELAGSRSLLEIRYENEVGTGLGPTLEFYALVSKELQRAELDMWRGEVTNQSPIVGETNSDSSIRYVFNKSGLFPQPLGRSAKSHHVAKIKNRFRLLGKFMAKALYDSRMIDIPLSIPFFKCILGQQNALSIADLHFLDESISKTVTKLETIARKRQKLAEDENAVKEDQPENAEPSDNALDPQLTLDGVPIEDLELDFTLPGYSNVELRKTGRDIKVQLNNVHQYVQLLTYWTLNEGVHKQLEAFKEGFESVFPISHLRLFYSNELEQLFCGSGFVQWDIRMLKDCCHPDHGYTLDSRAIKYLFEVLSSYTVEEQRSFLQFVTGSPRLPVGGLKSLNPPLTIVRKTFEPGEKVDDYLPSVMTCVNYLKLPDYSSLEVMREKLSTAANEGQHSFHLS